jgi:ribosomal protein S18 acetylase RimI-like enzyme
VDPRLLFPREIKDSLFERLLDRAKEVVQPFPGHPAQLIFQYHPSETSSIEYVTARGAGYSESVFRMMCDLTQELPAVPAPEQIQVRPWRMDSEEEQEAYVRARNEVFSETPVTLADWQSFLHLPGWETGTTFTAFDRQEIVGSVAVYWDEALSRQIGRKTGFTEYIFVRENWRKRGIAPFMIHQGLIYLKTHGREAALLEVKATNQRALELYYRLGYQLVDENRLYVFPLP